MTPTLADIVNKCAPVDQVKIGIDYQIIRHFSKHLYGSPNKAIEELITNSFDAFATKVFVYLPGKFVNDKVIVWDNGTAMDKIGLHELWWIARSPKDNGDRIVELKGKKRKVIGKFGIGKLASYAVGSRMTHLCRRRSEFLLVIVNYKILLGENGGAPHSYETPYETPILKLSKTQARKFVSALFNKGTSPKGVQFSKVG